MSSGLEKCYEAFERLKAGTPNLEEFVGLSQHLITPSIVSQEAGHDKGYLKKSRTNQQPLLSMISLHKQDHAPNTTGKGVLLQREKKKAKDARLAADAAEAKWEASLGRELQLYNKVKELEREVIRLSALLDEKKGVVQLPF